MDLAAAHLTFAGESDSDGSLGPEFSPRSRSNSRCREGWSCARVGAAESTTRAFSPSGSLWPRGSRPPVTAIGRKRYREGHYGRATGRWIKDLFQIVSGLGHTLCPRLLKPLTVHSMHTGANCCRMFFRMAGIEVCDAMGAERKQYAREFARQNSMEPQRLCKDVRRVSRAGRDRLCQSRHFRIRHTLATVQQNAAPARTSTAGSSLVQ